MTVMAGMAAFGLGTAPSLLRRRESGAVEVARQAASRMPSPPTPMDAPVTISTRRPSARRVNRISSTDRAGGIADVRLREAGARSAAMSTRVAAGGRRDRHRHEAGAPRPILATFANGAPSATTI